MSEASPRPLVLVVEDDPGIALLECEALGELGCDTLTAGCGAEVLATLGARSPTLMLLDYSLPDMTGLELLERIAAGDLKCPPFLVATGAGDEQVAVAMMRRGAHNYLVKDARFLEALPEAVVRALGDLETTRRLAEAEKRLRLAALVMENASEGVIVTGDDHVIREVNPAFELITGYARAEILGQIPSTLLPTGNDREALTAAIIGALDSDGRWSGEVPIRRKSGELLFCWFNISRIEGGPGEHHSFVTLFSDITFRKQAEDEIRNLAFYDPLTHLPNRRLMIDRLHQALANAERRGRHGAVMLLDLDNFKNLNDTLGHDAGDRLLVDVANRLRNCVRQGDTVARLGGDEFVVILEDLDDGNEAAKEAELVAEKIVLAVGQTYYLDIAEADGRHGRRQHHCTSSVGIALFAGQAVTVEELMKRADTSMYQAKASGRNTYRFFDNAIQAALAERADLEVALREAVVERQFIVHYQPQLDATGRVTGAEALVRWRHPTRGLIFPGEFIPVAEESGLILPLGFWVLEEACRQLARWREDPLLAGLTLAVNISARQFSLPNLVEQVMSLVDGLGAPPGQLKLELTESLLANNTADVIGKMGALRARGVHFSLDDFGTGYSSLAYLKLLPLDQLKIDKSFVSDVLSDPNAAAIARTVIALGEALGLAVIAEGVETAEQQAFLKAAGCLHYQGYLFGRPMPLAEFEACVLARAATGGSTHTPPESA